MWSRNRSPKACPDESGRDEHKIRCRRVDRKRIDLQTGCSLPQSRICLSPVIRFVGCYFLTTVCAVLALLVSLATQGHDWALAVSIAVGTLVLAALMSAVFFFVAWVAAQLVVLIAGRPRVGRQAAQRCRC